MYRLICYPHLRSFSGIRKFLSLEFLTFRLSFNHKGGKMKISYTHSRDLTVILSLPSSHIFPRQAVFKSPCERMERWSFFLDRLDREERERRQWTLFVSSFSSRLLGWCLSWFHSRVHTVKNIFLPPSPHKRLCLSVWSSRILSLVQVYQYVFKFLALAREHLRRKDKNNLLTDMREKLLGVGSFSFFVLLLLPYHLICLFVCESCCERKMMKFNESEEVERTLSISGVASHVMMMWERDNLKWEVFRLLQKGERDRQILPLDFSFLTHHLHLISPPRIWREENNLGEMRLQEMERSKQTPKRRNSTEA